MRLCLLSISKDICDRIPIFDARSFNIPESEVANYFLWRSQDCYRNMIDLTARTQFSHKDLMNKSTNDKRDMVFERWNELPGYVRNGWFYDPKDGDLMSIEDEKPTFATVDEIVEDRLNPEGLINYE